MRELSDDDVAGVAAEMAYRFLFALFPLLLSTVAVLGALGGPLGRPDVVIRLVEGARPFLPEQVLMTVQSFVARLATDSSITFLSIGLLGALWGAAGGIGALMKGLNRAYDVARPRPTVRRHLFALTAAAVLPPLAAILLLASIAGHAVAGDLGVALGLRPDVGALVALGQALVAFVVLFSGMAVVYLVLPATRQRARDVLPGAIIAAILWTVVTQGIGVYLAELADYRATYGGFAGAMALLLWLYLASLVVLLGAELNALLSPAGRRAWSGGERE